MPAPKPAHSTLFAKSRRPMTAYTDGASRGNPGESSFGVHVLLPDGKEVEMYGYLGRATNNQAEYSGLLAALLYAQAAGAEALAVRSDSELLVKQMLGFYRVQDKILKRFHARAVELSKAFASFEIAHVRREDNKRADKLANVALNLKKSSFPPELPFEELPLPT